jgi:hypothetical protein
MNSSPLKFLIIYIGTIVLVACGMAFLFVKATENNENIDSSYYMIDPEIILEIDGKTDTMDVCFWGPDFYLLKKDFPKYHVFEVDSFYYFGQFCGDIGMIYEKSTSPIEIKSIKYNKKKLNEK